MLKKILNLKSKNKKSAKAILKKYKGKYMKGVAEYTYLDNLDKGRIYEGKFSFTGLIEYETAKGEAMGRFSHNQKDGTWVYKRNHNIRLKINYHKGVPEGDYELLSQSSYYPESLSFSVSNGKFQGNISGNCIGFTWSEIEQKTDYYTQVRFKGQFDENGHSHGIWVFEDIVKENIFRATFEHGICQTFTREDITTGDYHTGSANFQKVIFSIIEDNYNRMEMIINRNCSPWKITPFVLS